MSLPAGVTIRVAGPDEAEALTHLHLDCWDDAYTGLIDQALLDARRDDVPDMVARWRTGLARGTTVVAECDGGLIGFAAAGPARDDDVDLDFRLHALYVRAAWWGRGVGHALFAAAVGDRAAYLCVLEGNQLAIGFYERQGFTLDGTGTDEPEGRHVRMVRPAY